MPHDDAFQDPILHDLTLELSAVAGRFASRYTELTGLHLTAEEAREIVLRAAIRDAAPAPGDAVASFASARIARGLPALAQPPATASETPIEITLKFDGGSAGVVHRLSMQLHGAVSEENSRRILVAAIDRGLSSLKRELGWPIDED